MKMYFSFSSRVNRTLSEKEIARNALLSDLEKTKKALEIAYAGFDKDRKSTRLNSSHMA